jgi:hypothetical protein
MTASPRSTLFPDDRLRAAARFTSLRSFDGGQQRLEAWVEHDAGHRLTDRDRILVSLLSSGRSDTVANVAGAYLRMYDLPPTPLLHAVLARAMAELVSAGVLLRERDREGFVYETPLRAQA